MRSESVAGCVGVGAGGVDVSARLFDAGSTRATDPSAVFSRPGQRVGVLTGQRTHEFAVDVWRVAPTPDQALTTVELRPVTRATHSFSAPIRRP
eukprot:355048-Chlamydomonas_euryale.AAC.13